MSTFQVAVVSFLMLVLTAGSSAIGQDGMTAAGCGPLNVKFDSKLADRQARPRPRPDKALVYFDENDAGYGSLNPPLTRIGIDGRWAGAMEEVSWFYVDVDPGPHQVCANWQTSWAPAATRTTQTALLTAQAGAVYYFEVRYEEIAGQVRMDLKQLEPDHGAEVIRKYFYCTSQMK